MTILWEKYTLPEQGKVELDVHWSFEINVTAEQAQQQVNRWLFTEVSCMMAARTPKLVIGETVVWRVPAVLTAAQVGDVGIVGEIDVDVQSGAMASTPERVAELQTYGIELGNKVPDYSSRGALPAAFVAKDFQPTHDKPTPNQALIEKLTDALATV